MRATSAVEMLGKPDDADPVWDDVAFYDVRYYLNDLSLRRASLTALIHVELNSSAGMHVEPSW